MNMKKSTLQLLIGIAMILVTFVADTVLAGNFYDFSDPNSLGVAQIMIIVIEGVLLIGGIVLIVMSRKLAKKEKEEAKQ